VRQHRRRNTSRTDLSRGKADQSSSEQARQSQHPIGRPAPGKIGTNQGGEDGQRSKPNWRFHRQREIGADSGAQRHRQPEKPALPLREHGAAERTKWRKKPLPRPDRGARLTPGTEEWKRTYPHGNQFARSFAYERPERPPPSRQI